MRKESSNFLSFLFSLLILLFIKDVQAKTLQQKLCSTSSSCGDIKNISYPFRLKGDPIGCGDADYELSCQSNKTILEFHSRKYYVKRISYDQQIVTVVDVNLANGSWSLLSNSLPRPSMRSDNRYMESDLNGNRLTLVSCSRKISENPHRRLLFFNKNQSYVFATYRVYVIFDLPKSCSFISTVPTRYAFVELPSYETINKWLQSGFDLIWSVECKDCNASAGNHCSMSLDGERYRFKCEGKSTFEISLFIIGVTFVGFLTTHLWGIISSLFFLYQSFLPYLPYQPYLTSLPFLLSLYNIENLIPYQLLLGIIHNLRDIIYNLTFRQIYDILDSVFVGFQGFLITRFVFVTVFIVLIICKYKRTTKTVDDVEKFLYNQQSWMPKRYSYMEIIAITNHFRNKLGQGGFGTVYKAQLLNGSLVAVKMLGNSKFSGEEFINEVSTIGRIHHSNVVRLVGFCSEGSKRALIYEYMPNGSLDRHIFSKKSNSQSFSWEKLQEIALGTARGIDYLHNGCDVCILHFDIKPHNILLDHNFNPKVADFGLAKLYPKENNFICVSATRGTIGYIAPELISRNFGAISCKSDVYSFGMLLLEMVGGRRNSFAEATRSSKAYFPSWVYDQIIEGRDLELQNVSSFKEVIGRKLCIIGLWCIQVKAADRPSITKVIEMLEGSIDDLQMPPKPFFSPSTQCNSIREIQSDSPTELLEYSETIEECSFTDHVNDV